MRDTISTPLRASRAAPRAAIAAVLLAMACGLGGCASGGVSTGSFAMAGGAPTVAFESIDGPPPQVFDRMVSVLDSETKLRSLQIVSREGAASYRVRSYLSAQVNHGRATIAWVWDVYDRDQQRALRLSGEEPAGKAGRDPWAAADDMVLRRIAQAGLSGLSGMINGTGPADAPPPAPAPGKRNPAVASAEVPSPVRPNSASVRSAASAPWVTAPVNATKALGRRFCAGKRVRTGCQPSPLLDITSLVESAGSVGVHMLNIVSSKARGEASMSAKNGSIKLVAGNSNPVLAQAIADWLDLPLTKAVVRRFADMEIFVEILENVRGSDVFIIQSTSFPANDHLMELLIITDALRRSSARRITAVIPYFGYARQDRKVGSRSPISAKLVANLITHAGVDRVMTLDLHAGQIQGFFDIPTDNLYASPVMVRDIKERFDLTNVMVVSPDVGGVVRARGLAKRINTSLAIIDKRRERAGESEVMNVIGDVAGFTCILVDDMVDSGGTLVNAADALLANGAKDVYAYISHGVLSGGAATRIAGSRLKELVITDSIQPTEAVRNAKNIRTLSIASLIGEAIGRTASEESVSSLFD